MSKRNLTAIMKLYRFSPIKNKEDLLQAVNHVHTASHKLCKQSFGKYLANAGNMGIFCHYDEEYNLLTKFRKELTEESNNVNQKYYRLHTPIIIPTQGDIPQTTYTHLYIRKPDPYRAQVGDIDFYLEPATYSKLKESITKGKPIHGARVFDRTDLDMIELYDPDVDVLAYVSTKMMTEIVRVKQ
ncbi:hypothetical protein HYV86_03160 [Candidatus Woesearchaeota archaeon]|nr:hypothetical protein [Candidatus Woesearchaeota archaeon]